MTSPTLVFVDSRLDDYQSLAQSASITAEVVILDSTQDGVEQITTLLAGRSSVDSIHIFSHGEPGILYLGSSQLSFNTLNHYANRLQEWATALAAKSELLLYGCYVAAGDRGSQFIQRLSTLTGANIAASTNLTGNAALGGDWELEWKTGEISSAPVLQPEIMESYGSVLADVAIPNRLYGVVDTVPSNPAIPSELRLANTDDGVSTRVGDLAFKTFALARQGSTGRLYYIEGSGNGRIAFFDPNTETNTILTDSNGNPLTTGVSNLFLKLAQGQNDRLYGLDVGTNRLYEIDINSTSPAGVAIELGNVTGLPNGSGDAAIDPSDPNRLIVSVTRPGSSTERLYEIYAVDIPTLTATLIGDTGLADEGSGAIAFGADGNLYATSAGNLYEIDPTNAQPTLVGATATFNDFATLPTPTASIDITLTKAGSQTELAPGTPVIYTIRVTNTSTTLDLDGIQVSDVLSDTVVGATWTAAITGNGGFPDLSDQSGAGDIDATVNLGASSIATYTVRGTIAAGANVGTILTNSATVTPPDGVIDPDLPNNTGIVEIEIIPLNTSPIATDDSTTTGISTPAQIQVLGNDRDPNNSPLSIANFTSGSNGTVAINDNGTPNQSADDFLVYTPNPSFVGTDTFAYTIRNANGGTSTANVTVTVTPITPPVATNDTVETDDGAPVQINALNNDRDPNNSPLSITNFTSGSNGTVAINDNGTPNQSADDFLVYTPNPGFVGTDTFTYTIRNTNGGTSTANVTVSVSDCVSGVTRKGNGRRNTLLGDNDINVLRGLRGNDQIRGFGCPDRLFGGRGNDKLRGGGARDTLRGQQNNDRLNGVTGDDRLLGGLGRDTLLGGTGNDTMRGGRGNDRLKGERGDDRLNGNQGNDRLGGGGGNDFIRGRINNDQIFGGGGNDRLSGGLGKDRIFSGAGDDFANGGNGEDRVFGGTGNDTLLGRAFNDLMDGGRGNDILKGQLNNDRLFGGRRRDQLLGGTGNDRLVGGNGRDLLNGGRGRDFLKGDANADRLIGHFGNDRLIGGGGVDRFIYRGLKDRDDRIADFDPTEDLIDLSRVFGNSRFGSSQRFANYVELSQTGANTTVLLDFNGDRSGGLRSFITLNNVTATSVTARSFIVS
jgi:Ca2+-binding RTX toxin-like protein